VSTPVQSLRVRTNIYGSWYTLTYNSGTGKFEKVVTAPAISSFNQPNKYFPITIEVTDLAGNMVIVDDNHATLGSACKLYVKELEAPTITVVSPSNGATVGTNAPAISIQLRDGVQGSGVSIDTFTLQIDGNVAIGKTASGMTVTQVTGGYDISYVAPSGYTDGPHTLSINVTDNDGNAAVQNLTTFTVDTAPPVLSVSSPTDGSATNQTTITVSGTTNDMYSSPVTVGIKVNGTTQGSVTVNVDGTFTKDINLAEGNNTIEITATDGVGKFSRITRTIALDTKGPQILGVELSQNSLNTGETFTVRVITVDA
jgi:hypothetical protein